MITIFNKGDKAVNEFLNGRQYFIQPGNSMPVSPKVAKELRERHPEALSTGVDEYSEEDKEAVAKLSKEQLLDFTLKIMTGFQPPVPKDEEDEDEGKEADDKKPADKKKDKPADDKK